VRLIEDVAIGQYGGTFSLTPHEGGTLARMIIDDERLREEE
jgi:hypothetical protein